MSSDSPVLVALDYRSAEEALRMARRLENAVGGFKVGLELLTGPGPATVAAIAELGMPVFADAKLHDIPNTAGAAARQLARMGAQWVSVHAAGGSAMMEAAAAGFAAENQREEAGLLAITVLTSMNAAKLAAVGVQSTVGKQTARLSKLAASAGCRGVVCPGSELPVVATSAPGLLRVTPGIRRADDLPGDQELVMTPEGAIGRGADLIVVGRAITRAPDPLEAAEEISARALTAQRESAVG